VPPIFAQANGAPLVYVGYDPPSPGGEALVVPRDSQIRNVTDLRGKRIALNEGSNVHYLLVQCLEAHGLSLEDVHPVHRPPKEMGQSFDISDVDAVVAWDPFLTAALRTGNVRVLIDGTGLVANHQFHVARAEFAARHPDVIEAVLGELHKIGRSAVSNPAKAARSLLGEIDIDTWSLEIAIRRPTHRTKPLDLGVIREQQKIADRFYALGLIPRAIAVRDAVWVSPSRA
jgi:ABC-type nitrate/sulfonate/bicarbonate transport system substrate-binding protein